MLYSAVTWTFGKYKTNKFLTLENNLQWSAAGKSRKKKLKYFKNYESYACPHNITEGTEERLRWFVNLERTKVTEFQK